MEIPPRHPYAGELVFTAFSGSHQDAIKKGMAKIDKKQRMCLITIDPEDIGKRYQAIIRINSQSGKGGVAYILEQDYQCIIPKTMQLDVASFIQKRQKTPAAKYPQLKFGLFLTKIYQSVRSLGIIKNSYRVI